MTPAPARSHRRTHARSTAPRGPRRVSGPVSRRMVAAPAGTAALPRRTGTTGIFARVRALPEHRVVDRLLRSRAWIWVLGALLGGIVAMQVSLLKLNSGISRAVETTTTLERQNAGLEQDIARLSRTDRIQLGAESLGMVLPPAGEVGYLSTRPDDPSRAVRHMQPPSEEAAALLANGGIVPGSLADQTTTSQLTADTTTTTPAPVETETATTPPAAAEPVTPVATPTPQVEAAPPTTTSQVSPSGGATAPQG